MVFLPLVVAVYRLVSADTDGNGVLDCEEFDQMMQKEFVQQQMKKLVRGGVNLTQDELKGAWQLLDVDGSGQLSEAQRRSDTTAEQERHHSHTLAVGGAAVRDSCSERGLQLEANECTNALAISQGAYCEELKRQNEQVDAWVKDSKATRDFATVCDCERVGAVEAMKQQQ
eukprot:3544211-Amphidinium_carterae.1